MKVNVWYLTLILSIALALASCATTSNTGFDGEWSLFEVKTEGNLIHSSEHPLSKFTLNFEQDGRLSGNDGCNQWKAKYDLIDNTLSVSGVIATKKYCRFNSQTIQALNQVYTAKLQTSVKVSRSNDMLKLSWGENEYWLFSSKKGAEGL